MLIQKNICLNHFNSILNHLINISNHLIEIHILLIRYLWYSLIRIIMRNSALLFLFSIFLACSSDENSKLPIDISNLSEVLINSPNEIRGKTFAIMNVNIVPMTHNTVIEDQAVIIENELISWIGPSSQASIPKGAEVIDANGIGYLIPGLMDMHFHRSTVDDLFLFLANGVTIAREMWGSTTMLDLRDQILDEKLDFPQFFVASPGMNGAGGAWEQFTPPVTTIEQAKLLVKQYKEVGFDFIKVYNKLEPQVYNAIIKEASFQDIKVIGHVPEKVGPETVFQSGQTTTEHFIGFGYFASSKNTISDGILDPLKVAELAMMSVDNNLWHVPTITVDSQSAESILAAKKSDEYQLISDNLKNTFETGFFQGQPTAKQSEANHKEVLRALRTAGSRLLLGTDAGFGYIVPGFSIHDELIHYVDAGLSNYEALETATINPAIFLGIENSVGTIEIGKSANLVLLESNPLDNISSTKDKAGVVVRGTWLSEEFLMKKIKNKNN